MKSKSKQKLKTDGAKPEFKTDPGIWETVPRKSKKPEFKIDPGTWETVPRKSFPGGVVPVPEKSLTIGGEIFSKESENE